MPNERWTAASTRGASCASSFVPFNRGETQCVVCSGCSAVPADRLLTAGVHTKYVYPFYETNLIFLMRRAQLLGRFFLTQFIRMCISLKPKQDYHWPTNVQKDLSVTTCMCLPIRGIDFPCRTVPIGRHRSWSDHQKMARIVWLGGRHTHLFDLSVLIQFFDFDYSTRSEWDDDIVSINGGDRPHWRWSESPEKEESLRRSASRSSTISKRSRDRGASNRTSSRSRRSRSPRKQSRTRRSRSPQSRSRRSRRSRSQQRLPKSSSKYDAKRSRSTKSRSRSSSKHRRRKSKSKERIKSRQSRTPSKSNLKLKINTSSNKRT